MGAGVQRVSHLFATYTNTKPVNYCFMAAGTPMDTLQRRFDELLSVLAILGPDHCTAEVGRPFKGHAMSHTDRKCGPAAHRRPPPAAACRRWSRPSCLPRCYKARIQNAAAVST